MGFWTDSEGSGYVYWGDTGSKEGDNGFVSLSSWQEVEKLYYEVFHRLSEPIGLEVPSCDATPPRRKWKLCIAGQPRNCRSGS